MPGTITAPLPTHPAVQEAVLGGQLSASLPGGRLEYRKRFKLPNGALLALGAGLQVTGGGSDGIGAGRRRQRPRRLKPFLTCQLQMDSSSSGGGSDEVVVSESGFSDTHRFNLPTR